MTNPQFWREVIVSGGIPLVLVLVMIVLRKSNGLAANAGADSVLWVLGLDAFFVVRPDVVKANTTLSWVVADPTPWSMLGVVLGFLALVLCASIEALIKDAEAVVTPEDLSRWRALRVPALVLLSYAPLLLLATAHFYVFYPFSNK